MKKILLIFAVLLSIQASAQDETLLIESDASVVLSGNVKLILGDISLKNEGSLDLSTSEVIIEASSPRTISTNASLEITTLTTGNDGGTISMEGAYVFTDFTLESSDAMSFSDTSSLILTGTISNPGNLIMTSGSSLFIETSISGISSVTIERTTTFDESTGKYSVVSSPVENSPFNALGTNAQSWIYEYNEDVPYGADGSAKFDTPSETEMVEGKGYFSAFTGDENGTMTFTGIPNYSNVNYAITHTNNAGDITDVEGFNLVGNPFTCPIDFDTFISNSNNESLLDEQTIWIWDDFASDAGGGSNLDYVSVNVVGASSGDSRNGGLTDWDGTINVGQGFFVKASSSGNIRFNQGMKTLEGNDDASFFRVEEIEKLWFDISNNNDEKGSSTLLGFLSDASEHIDRYDASRFGQGLAIYSIVDGKKLAIQGTSNDWINDGNTIALGYNVKESGTFSISLKGSENSILSELYLIDNTNGKSTNILKETYSFDSEAGSFNDRFTLSSNPLVEEEILVVNEKLDIKVWGQSNQIMIQSQMEGVFKIWSLSGTMLSEGILTDGETQIAVYQNNIYIVAIESEEGIATYKVKVGM